MLRMFDRMPSEIFGGTPKRMADNGAGGAGSAAGGMPAANKPGGSEGEGAGAGQQPAGTGTGSQAAGSDGMSLDQALAELERAKKMLKESNAESAGRRKRLEELEAAETQRQQAQMSEAEKALAATKRLQEQIATYEQQVAELRQASVRYEVMLKAQEMGLIDLDAAVRLMDMGALEFDEAGKPTNVEKVLKSLVTAKPYLVKQDAKSPGLGTPPQKPRTPGAGSNERPVRRVTPL